MRDKKLSSKLKNLPDPIRKSKRFVLWKTEWSERRQALVKTPYYTNGRRRKGKMGTKTDLEQLGTLKDALGTIGKSPNVYDGLGFVLADEGIGAFDIDECLDPEGEMITNHAGRPYVEKAESQGAYIEISPSGTGLRILGPCEDSTVYSRNKLEYWGTNRFVTLTGNLWANAKGWKDLSHLRASLPTRDTEDRKKSSSDPDTLVTGKTIEELRSALKSIDADERDLWIRMGHALKTLDDRGFDLWMEWSKKSDKFREDDAIYTWETLSPHNITYKSVFQEAQDNWEWENPKAKKKVVEDGVRGKGTLLDYALDFGKYDLQPTEFVLDGFMACGVNILSGGWGAGKSTNLIPLAASVAHLSPKSWGFHPELRRHVLWVTEAPDQTRDTIYSMMQEKGSAGRGDWREWFHVIPALRENPNVLSKQIQQTLPELTYTLPSGFAVRPFVVLDTVSSNLDLENESDNSEVANAMSRLKERLRSVPLLLIGHTTKAATQGAHSIGHRGAGAWEADASGTYYLTTDENGIRFIGMSKTRFQPQYPEIAFGFKEGKEQVETEWGAPQMKGYLHGVPRRSSETDRANPETDPQSAFRENPLPQERGKPEDIALRLASKYLVNRTPLTAPILDAARPESVKNKKLWKEIYMQHLTQLDTSHPALKRHMRGKLNMVKTLYTVSGITTEQFLEDMEWD